eukprot:CAMPEP_0184744274 /NCGR_PEP_ID=MMETSP0315-20130426/7094_1 /TAXON_ID=101924 /ORGANISM="Rhodosorus marinus, Strain UTEX LB 2760" /LENGTH=181 /DNA_ID=CAMNT_0027215957 /DNA_START=51 /DNA_END=596 /DNA_ORIENTATION=-
MSAFAIFACGSGGSGAGGGQNSTSRREFLRIVKVAAPAILIPTISVGSAHAEVRYVRKTDEEWWEELPPDAFYVLRKNRTERSGTSPLNKEYRKGVYSCRGCEAKLFSSETKFDSGTGWPSFYDAYRSVVHKPAAQDFILGGTEVRCAVCDGHIGHVFRDGPKPTRLRYCVNGAALTFTPA